MNDCESPVKQNLGLSRCNALPALIKSMIVTPEDYSMTAVNAALQAQWQNALLADITNRIYLWPNFVSFENLSTPAVYEETPLAYLAVRDGNYRWRFGIKENLCFHRAMFTHRANGGRVFLIDVENQIIGMENAAGDFQGFKIQLLHTEKLIISDGTVSTKSPIVVALQDNTELDESGVLVSAPFITSLNRLTDVTIAIVSSTGTIVCTVKQTCDQTPVSGLVKADFVKTDSAGASESISTVVEGTGDDVGTYTLTATTAFTDGFLDLVSPATLSIEAYETTPVAVDMA